MATKKTATTAKGALRRSDLERLRRVELVLSAVSAHLENWHEQDDEGAFDDPDVQSIADQVSDARFDIGTVLEKGGK